jgi:hypothetical protein
MIIHYNDEKRLSVAMEYFKAAYRLGPEKTKSCSSCSRASCLTDRINSNLYF